MRSSVQSIPAVYALRNGQVVDGFLGAVPERDVERFVQTLLPTEEQTTVASLVAAGDETSLRKAIELDPGNEDAVVALAALLVEQGNFDEALALLERIPESERTRPIAAAARLGDRPARRSPSTSTTPSSPSCCRGSRTTTRPASSTSTSSS